MRHIPLNSVAISAREAFREPGDGKGRVIRNLDSEPLAGSRYWFEPGEDTPLLVALSQAYVLKQARNAWR
jgi:hypothetical protein